MSKAPALFRLFFLFGIFFIFTFVISNYTSSQSKFEVNNLSAQNGNQQKSVVDPTPTPHNLVGSFYTLAYNTDAKLLLNNKGNTQLEVQPTLYNKQGQELQLPSVTVEPQSFRFINLADWAAIGGESYKTGNIKLFHTGKDLVLGAQIYLTQETYSVGFEEKLTELGKFDSRRQEAVWVMPTQQTKAEVILTNTTDASLSVTAKLAKNPNTTGNPQTFQLAAHETKVLDLRQDFVNGNQFANSTIVGLSLEHTGAQDALLARVMVGDIAKGYSNVVQFSNPAGGKSSEYQGVGFQIEDVAGQHLVPVIVARNVGTTAATITTRVPYTRIDGTRDTINLPQKQLAAGELGLINTQSIVTRVQQEQIKVASLEVEYNTAPGSVIVATHSVSTDGNQVFRVPMWDPLGHRSPTGGYPWRIEGTSVTETYIKNIADYEEDYVAFVVWENGGMYMLGLKPIAAHETVQIDVKKLRDEQIPDEKGRTIPLSVSSGQLQWTLRRKDNLPDDDTRANLALFGRSEQVDITKGVTNNYSCENCCSGSHSYGFIFPNSVEIEYGETAHYIAVEAQETCYGFPYEFNIGADWSSSNSGLGTISGGDITPQGAGQSSIGASWSAFRGIVYPCPPGGETLLLFGFQDETANNCNENKNKRGGPSAFENERNFAGSSLLIPPCGACQMRSFTFIPPTATLTVKPKVTISPIEVVGKDSTRQFSVQVLPPNNTEQITLTIEQTSGSTGDAQFNDTQSRTKPISSSQNVTIKGITESSAKDNFLVKATWGNTTSPSQPKFSVAKVKISRTIDTQQPTDVTDATTETIVGERIKLNAELLPSGITISSQSWTIPNTIVKDFTVWTDHTHGGKVDVDPLNTATTNFVWVDGGGATVNDYTTKQVDHKITVNGYDITGKSTFQVKRPVVSLQTVTQGTNIILDNGVLQLIFATSSDNGIVFKNTVAPSIPGSYGGTTQWVQIVNRSNISVTVNGQTMPDNKDGLDGCYPYEIRGAGRTEDSPFVELPNVSGITTASATVDDDFTMWLMYKPGSTNDSVWVPLKKVSWFWKASATYGPPWSSTGNNSMNPSFADTVTFPTWNKLVPAGGTCPVP